MPDLPKSVIGRMKAQAAPAEHPDADLLTAFSEQALTGRERENVLAHLAACAACRETVALAAPQPVAVQPGAVLVPWYRRPQIFAWAGTLATLALVGALLLNFGQTRYTPMVSDSTPPKVATSPPAENKPAVPSEREAGNGSLGALRAESAHRAAAPAKAEPEPRKKAEAERARRDMDALRAPASAPAPVQAPAKDQKKLDGGVLRDQYSAMNAPIAAPPLPPAPAAQAANVVNEKPQPAASGALTMESTAATAKSAGAAGGAVGGVMYGSRAKMAVAPLVRWSISDKGKLQRSSDSGRTWQPALANENTVFRSVAVAGNQVWAGGAAATLFHSADGGATWTKQALPGASADVVSLQFSDALHGSARTADEISWSTSDGGQHWAKQ